VLTYTLRKNGAKMIIVKLADGHGAEAGHRVAEGGGGGWLADDI
jgi:hypothetical protein